MSTIEGTSAEKLAKVQAIFEQNAPGSRCQIQDYGFRIGCGMLDHKEDVVDEVFVIHDLSVEVVTNRAKRLSRIAATGSTAG